MVVHLLYVWPISGVCSTYATTGHACSKCVTYTFHIHYMCNLLKFIVVHVAHAQLTNSHSYISFPNN